jgi:hypothetical protein
VGKTNQLRWLKPVALNEKSRFSQPIFQGGAIMVAQRKLKKDYADQIEERAIDWLWRPWLARGVISVMDGNPSAGKSTLMFDLTARITTGRPFPHVPGGERSVEGGGNLEGGGSQPVTLHAPPSTPSDDSTPIRPPGRVLWIPLEDPVQSIVRPHLRIAGSDMSRIIILRGIDEVEPKANLAGGLLQLPRDLDLIDAECREFQPELLIIDPFFAILGMDEKNRYIKANDDQSVRRLIARLKVMAEERGLAIVLLRHLNKAAGGSALKRGCGSIAISALARTVMLVGNDQLGPDSRVLAMVKTNLDAMPRSLNFRVNLGPSGPTVQWQGASDLSADDLVARANSKELHPALRSAVYFLKMTLFEHFELTWAQLTALAAAENISEGTLRRAREIVPLLKIVKGKNHVVWSLTQDMTNDLWRQRGSH